MTGAVAAPPPDVLTRFDGLADAYDRFRPDYPPALFAAILARAPEAPSCAADLAAGTGISTARLLGAVPPNWRVQAIEPGEDMRRALARRFADEPRVEIVNARAEALPLERASLAVLTVCTAFHWIDRAAFFPEAARVLAPGGVLAVARNTRVAQPVLDAFDAWFAERSPEREAAWRMGHRDQEAALSAAPGFEALESVSIRWTRAMDEASLIAMFLTRSTAKKVVEALGRAAVEAALSALYRAEIGRGAMALDYDAVAFSVRRAPQTSR